MLLAQVAGYSAREALPGQFLPTTCASSTHVVPKSIRVVPAHAAHTHLTGRLFQPARAAVHTRILRAHGFRRKCFVNLPCTVHPIVDDGHNTRCPTRAHYLSCWPRAPSSIHTVQHAQRVHSIIIRQPHGTHPRYAVAAWRTCVHWQEGLPILHRRSCSPCAARAVRAHSTPQRSSSSSSGSGSGSGRPRAWLSLTHAGNCQEHAPTRALVGACCCR